MSTVLWRERLVDALGLLLLVVGGALYTRAYLGMRTLRDSAFVQGQPWVMVHRWARLVTLSRWGLVVAATGLLVLIGATWLGSRARAQRAHTRPPLADPAG